MKILYDYQTFTEQNFGGISRYFTEVIKLLRDKGNHNYDISSLISNNYYLNKNGLNRYKFLPKLNFKGKRKLMRIVNKNYSRAVIKEQEFDIFHPTYYDPYFSDVLGKKPYVITVHDLIEEIFKKDSSRHVKIRNQMRKLIANANHIIAISNNTKQDIIKYYGIFSDKITVSYHGSPFMNINAITECNLKLPKKYFLFVGNRNGYKNFHNLIVSIANLLLKEQIFLICIGGGPPNMDEMRLIHDLKIDKNIIFYPTVTDDELVTLYKNSIAFISPSKYEGFGIPTLEAMSCNCPVILSNTSSFLEVAGDAAIYFDPNSMDSILDGVKSIIQSRALREDLIRKGTERVKLFTWENTYLKTLEVYKKLI